MRTFEKLVDVLLKKEFDENPKPLGYYIADNESSLRFHLLNVGEGLMILIIFPNKKTMLYDCNIMEDNKEQVIKFLEEHIPVRYDVEAKVSCQWIDIFVNSHRDIDHLRGLKHICDQFEIRGVWDSGQSGNATETSEYNYYMQLKRTIQKVYGERSVKVPMPSTSPFISFGNAKIYCLNSCKEFNSDKLKDVKIQHTNSIVLSIHYGSRSILLTGDSDWKAWRDKIVPNFKSTGILNSNILIASHHGSRSFFTDEDNETIDLEANAESTYIESIEYISPSITLISCGDFEEQHHPNKEALEIYRKYTANDKRKQVYTTHDKGILSGYIAINGRWTVVPSRFKPFSNSQHVTFRLLCTANSNGQTFEVRSGKQIAIGAKLEFSIQARGGLLEPYNKVTIIWEVSNAGINNDSDHQEIYYKTDKESNKAKFFRDLSYEGKHLLRCKVRNFKKGHNITRIFEVDGIKYM